jgi:hypothetical protein
MKHDITPLSLTVEPCAKEPAVTAHHLKNLMSRYAISTKELARWLDMSHTYVYTLLAQEGELQCRADNAEKLGILLTQPTHLCRQWQRLAHPPHQLLELVGRIIELNLSMIEVLRRLPPPVQVCWVAAFAQPNVLPTHLDDWLPWADALWWPQAKVAKLWVSTVKQVLTQGKPTSVRFSQCLEALELCALSP